MKNVLQITLESDLCASSGENFGVHIDSDVHFDRYGLPHVPSKRLKGCLRAAAMELCDFGLLSRETVDGIFGKRGGQRGSLVLRNAQLKNHKNYVDEINLSPFNELRDPQRVLACFTYKRTQTAIAENGIARPHSLRTSRVVRKNLVFICEFSLDDRYIEAFVIINSALRHIGLNRTRGLGLVKSEIHESARLIENAPTPSSGAIKSDSSQYQITYTLKLLDPLMFPRAEGGARKTESHIPGSSVMGFFASRMKGLEDDDYYRLFYRGALVFGNGYITDGRTRFVPAAASIRKNKAAGLDKCINSIAAYNSSVNAVIEELRQSKPVNDLFLANEINASNYMEVDTEINYHHQLETEAVEREFYQYDALSAGQLFSGVISGCGRDIARVIDAWPSDGIFTLGRSITAQYGHAVAVDVKVNEIKRESRQMSDIFAVQLLSPCLILDVESGNASLTIDSLKKAVESIVGENLTCEHSVMRYKLVGGFNSTWKLPKPQTMAFDAGTICVFRTESGAMANYQALNETRVGERISEGYGEVAAYRLSDAQKSLKLSPAALRVTKIVDDTLPFDIGLTRDVLRREAKQKIIAYATIKAKGSAMRININSTTLHRIALMLAESEGCTDIFAQSILDIKDVIKRADCFRLLFDPQKKIDIDDINIMFKDINILCNHINSFIESIRGNAIPPEYTPYCNLGSDEILSVYMNAYISQIKYMLRGRTA